MLGIATRLDNENAQNPQKESSSGGCSVGCASFFALCLLWPLLHALGDSYEPEVLLFPMLFGGSAFVVTHILAIAALSSRASETQRKGKRALWILWGGIALVVLLALIGFVIELIRGKP